jgi:hypothetical protein
MEFWGPPRPLYEENRVTFRGVQRLAFTTHLHVALKLKKEWSYTSTPLWAFMTFLG